MKTKIREKLFNLKPKWNLRKIKAQTFALYWFFYPSCVSHCVPLFYGFISMNAVQTALESEEILIYEWIVAESLYIKIRCSYICVELPSWNHRMLDGRKKTFMQNPACLMQINVKENQKKTCEMKLLKKGKNSSLNWIFFLVSKSHSRYRSLFCFSFMHARITKDISFRFLFWFRVRNGHVELL